MKKITIFAIWLAISISGCGGGSDAADVLDDDAIFGADSAQETNSGGRCVGLEFTYDRITKNMKPNEVRILAGCEPLSQLEWNGKITSMTFIDVDGAGMAVNFDYEYRSGAAGKSYIKDRLVKIDTF